MTSRLLVAFQPYVERGLNKEKGKKDVRYLYFETGQVNQVTEKVIGKSTVRQIILLYFCSLLSF